MWMLKSNDHGNELKTSMDYPIYGRKLRPLMPRPSTSCCSKTKITPFSTITTPCSCICNPSSLPWNHQPISAVMGSYNGAKREMIERVPLVTTRWNPTPEQLHALEEMYRRGITTPSAEQIQQIAAKLRRFGKIEGKNVFYWFQNHKARERQKKRRHLELLAGKKIQQVSKLETKKQTGLSRRSHFEFEHQSKLSTPSNSNALSEDSESMHGAVVAECKKDEWTQLNQKIATAKKETCLSPCLSPNNSVNNITAQKISGQQHAEPFGAVNRNILLLPTNNDNINLESGIKENQTLQLFPIGSSGFSTEEEVRDVSCIGTTFRPNVFIEFLPTKN